MTESDDNVPAASESATPAGDEHLLAQALHAHVGSEPAESDLGPPADTAETPAEAWDAPPERRPLPAYWVLLLAVLLGGAAGAVAGLLSLL